jgi:hypothetical protein
VASFFAIVERTVDGISDGWYRIEIEGKKGERLIRPSHKVVGIPFAAGPYPINLG